MDKLKCPSLAQSDSKAPQTIVKCWYPMLLRNTTDERSLIIFYVSKTKEMICVWLPPSGPVGAAILEAEPTLTIPTFPGPNLQNYVDKRKHSYFHRSLELPLSLAKPPFCLNRLQTTKYAIKRDVIQQKCAAKIYLTCETNRQPGKSTKPYCLLVLKEIIF